MKLEQDLVRKSLAKIIAKTPSPEQWIAIEAPLEPGLIVAGAGTGKTTVMAARIAWLVMTGKISPDRILGLTFTTKATSELQNRVRSYLPAAIKFAQEAGFHTADEMGEPTILTYNAFGSRLLKEHALRLGLEPGARVVVDATRYQLGMRVVCNTDVDLSNFGFTAVDAVSDLIKLDEQLANYLIEPDLLIETDLKTIANLDLVEKPQAITEAMRTTCAKRIELAKLVKAFRLAKISADIIDYSDQIRLAAKAAQTSIAMQELLKEQFGVVLLDEYQDTGIGQKVLLQSLFGNGHPVTAVGDPCQAIYGWRGAEITNMDLFPTDFPIATEPFKPANQFNLTGNRRSGENILAAANTLSEQLRELHPIISPLEAKNEEIAPGKIQVGLLNTFEDEVQWIADQVANLDLGDNWGQVAVLIRENKHIGYFVKALEDRNIPVQVADAGALINLPEVRDVISYLMVTADPTSNTALARILTSPRWAIGPRDLALLGREASELVKSETRDSTFSEQFEMVAASTDRVDRACLLDALELAGESEMSYSPEARARMVALASELRDLRKHVSNSIPELISRIVRVTGIGIQAMLHQEGKQVTGFDRISALMDLAGSYSNLDGETSLRAFMAFLSDAGRFNQHTAAEISLLENAVTVMSIHKSKGLEFPIVVLPEVTKSVFPSGTNLSHWPKSANRIPTELLPKNIYSKVPTFPINNVPKLKDYEVFTKSHSSERDIDERRLAYVAVTRAEHTLIASASWWGPTQVKTRGPSDFLVAVKKHENVPGIWELAPDDDAINPLTESVAGISWPQDTAGEIRPKLIEAAKLVTNPKTEDVTKLSADELALIKQWDADLESIEIEFDRSKQTERIVKLPASLSASQVMDLKKDEQSFLKTLVRPMPRKPSPAATRGTKFHAWVEEFYHKRALIDPETLPGAGDSDIYSDEVLAQMKEAFQTGLFAERPNAELELPFALVIKGRTWRGRIDAIFKGTLENPDAPGWLVVDWKTGKSGTADELQLSIYRHALAELKQCDPEEVQAAFYYVSEKVVAFPQKLLSREDLEDLI